MSCTSTDTTTKTIDDKSAFSADENGSFSGDLYVTGYASQKSVLEPFCESDCVSYQGIFFTIDETDSEAFADFSAQNEGNAFVSWDTVMLGCVDENFIISYANDSDAAGMQELSLDSETSLAILNATQSSPIRLKLTKDTLTWGGWAPACYSHFTKIELINT